MTLENTGLLPNLNKPRRKKFNPERELDDRSVEYAKLRLTGSLKSGDFDPTSQLPWSQLAIQGGWISLSSDITLTFSSDANPNFIVTTSEDLSNIIPVGARLTLVQSSTQKYFLVHAIDSTTITLYGGTDYTLADATISDVYYSFFKSPVGFSLDPADWSVRITDTTDRTQASPVSGTWYNIGTTNAQIVVPIGIWVLKYWVNVSEYVSVGAPTQVGHTILTTLSTANNTEADTTMTSSQTNESYSGAGNPGITLNAHRQKFVALSSQTTYYLNSKSQGTSPNELRYNNDWGAMVLEATSAYL